MAKFRTRARAVDMLGRQQIAGIPTAISELFKNAHDAYADHAEVDYYRSDGLFVLRDDGLGMTEDEFVDRWLVIGTESKLGASAGLPPPPRDPAKQQRPILGEKGIGRLAIGVIGPQVLVMTRAKRKKADHDLVVAFIHWGLFALPGVNLEDIDVPVRTFKGGQLPTREDVQQMVAQTRQTLRGLPSFVEPQTLARIEKELTTFDVDPTQLDQQLGSPSLSGAGHGTHFIILPADDALVTDIDRRDDPDSAAPLLKMLIGFTNTMTPGHEAPRITTAFRDHRSVEDYEDLIEESAFFTPEEFRIADHHIAGSFDEYGQFVGTVSVYRRPEIQHVVAWPAAKGNPTECGPFRINLAVVQGESKATLVEPEQYQVLTKKMDHIGGLYIYKDGIRVLPYGNNDYDFINIERNRTKSAYYYYFSYRRIFGVIEISSTANRKLSEKAGREGFRQSPAYTQFREILTNFFVQTAADFFRDDGVHADDFLSKKEELDRLHRAKIRRAKQITARRKLFADAVSRTLDRIAAGDPEKRADELVQTLERQLRAATSISQQDRAATAVLDAESSARQAVRALREEFTVRKPRGITLSRALTREWEAVAGEMQRIEVEAFLPAEQLIDDAVRVAAEKAELAVDRRRRLERAVTESIERASKATKSETQQTRDALHDVEKRVGDLTHDAVAAVDAAVRRAQTEVAQMNLDPLSDDDFAVARTRLEELIVSTAEQQQHALEYVAEQLRTITWFRDADGSVVTSADIAESLEEEVQALRERSAADLELAQLGMAIEVINHEFEGTIKSVRSNLRRLKAWADANAGLNELYTNIRTSFEHLDGYLTLFTPLHRRLYRQEIEITGSAINKFLSELFSERLARHAVTLASTPGFLQHSVRGYPSTFYPVFVNLVDNALFWLKDRPQPRVVRLAVDGEDFIVADTGPGVANRDRKAIFESGFTRKPGGRGLGLHISREALARVGFELTLEPSAKGQGAAFRIARSVVVSVETDS